MKKQVVFVLLPLLMTLCACNFEKIGNQLSAGVKKNAEGIGKDVVTGVSNGFDESLLKRQLNHLLDSMILNAGAKGQLVLKPIIDTLLSDKWIVLTSRLIEEATGKKLNGNIAALKESLLGADTRQRIQLLVATAMNGILNDRLQITAAKLREELTGLNLRNNLIELRDSLLNNKTQTAVKGIVDSAVSTLVYHLNNDLKEGVGKNLSLVQKYASELLILVGVIALVIIIVIWRLKEKYAKMTTVIASQINNIPSEDAYNDLTARIKDKATVAGVEPALRKVLEKNGLLGRESWEAKKKAILRNQN